MLCKALQALCDLVSNDVDKQRWLYAAGVLPLAQRLLRGRNTGGGRGKGEGGEDKGGEGQGGVGEVEDGLGGQRPEGCPAIQTARLLSMLSAEPTVAVRCCCVVGMCCVSGMGG